MKIYIPHISSITKDLTTVFRIPTWQLLIELRNCFPPYINKILVLLFFFQEAASFTVLFT